MRTRAGPDSPSGGAPIRLRDFGLKQRSTNCTISPVSRSGVSRSSSTDDAWTRRAFGSSRTSMSESEKGWIGSR